MRKRGEKRDQEKNRLHKDERKKILKYYSDTKAVEVIVCTT